MTQHARIYTLILCVLMIVSLTACGNSSNPIVGEWSTNNPEIVFKFFQDGTVTWKQARKTYTGQYKFLDSANVRLDMMGDLGQQAVVLEDVSISGDTLALTLSDQKLVFNRVKEGGVQSSQSSPSPVVGGPNLAPNPSFEAGTNQPIGWTTDVRGEVGASPVWASNMTHTGKRSLGIINATLESPWVTWVSQEIPVQPGHTYELSVCYRNNGTQGSGIIAADAQQGQVHYFFNDSIANVANSMGPNRDWECFTGTSSFSESSIRLRFLATPEIGNAGIWIDDLSFRDLSVQP